MPENDFDSDMETIFQMPKVILAITAEKKVIEICDLRNCKLQVKMNNIK